MKRCYSNTTDMSPSDIIIATLFYQFSLYVCIRLAKRGFTLGELAVVCSAATALFMESVNLTRMKVSNQSCCRSADMCRLPSFALHTSRPTAFLRLY